MGQFATTLGAKCVSPGPQNGHEVDALSSQTRNAIFDDFRSVPKSTKNDKSSTLGRPMAKSGTHFGRVGGRGGRLGKSFSRGFISFGTSFGRTISHA